MNWPLEPVAYKFELPGRKKRWTIFQAYAENETKAKYTAALRAAVFLHELKEEEIGEDSQ